MTAIGLSSRTPDLLAAVAGVLWGDYGSAANRDDREEAYDLARDFDDVAQAAERASMDSWMAALARPR